MSRRFFCIMCNYPMKDDRKLCSERCRNDYKVISEFTNEILNIQLRSANDEHNGIQVMRKKHLGVHTGRTLCGLVVATFYINRIYANCKTCRKISKKCK